MEKLACAYRSVRWRLPGLASFWTQQILGKISQYHLVPYATYSNSHNALIAPTTAKVQIKGEGGNCNDRNKPILVTVIGGDAAWLSQSVKHYTRARMCALSGAVSTEHTLGSLRNSVHTNCNCVARQRWWANSDFSISNLMTTTVPLYRQHVTVQGHCVTFAVHRTTCCRYRVACHLLEL